MVRKTKEEALLTRNQLLDAAEALFSEQGVAKTSLHEIAESAGLTRGAVYWHFDNKGDLLKAMWERIAGPLRDSFDSEEVQYGESPLDRIRLKASYRARIIEENPRVRALMTILMLRCEFTEETSSATDYFMGEREHGYACIRDDIQLAIANGQIAPDTDADQATVGLFGLTDGICFHWLINPSRFNLCATTLQALDAYLAGLSHR